MHLYSNFWRNLARTGPVRNNFMPTRRRSRSSAPERPRARAVRRLDVRAPSRLPEARSPKPRMSPEPRSPPSPRVARRPAGNAQRTAGPFLAPPCHSLLRRPARAPMDAAEGPVVAGGLPGRPYKGALPSCPGRAAVKPPPAPLLAAAASSRPGRLCTEPSVSPPSLASTKARRHAHPTRRTPPRRHGMPRRPLCLAAGAAPRRPSPYPIQPPESAPWDPGTLPRPCPAGPGRRLAGIWPDRRCPAARNHIAKRNFFPGSLLQKVNSNSKSDFPVSCKLRIKT
jgi:hypothetical protein